MGFHYVLYLTILYDLLFSSNSTKHCPPKQGAQLRVLQGHHRRRIEGSFLRQSLWLPSRRGIQKRNPVEYITLLYLGKRTEKTRTLCRLSLLEKEQGRLAKLDKLRQAVKSDAEMRFEREREELGMKVESRVQKAENNRMQLLHARLQRQAALEERTKRYFMKRLAGENKYRERVQSAMQKHNAAEKRRSGLLEFEKRQAQGRLLQVQLAARTASNQRETERSKLKEQLEEKLQKVCISMMQHRCNCFSSLTCVITIYIYAKIGKAAEG